MKITVIGESNIDIVVVPQSPSNAVGCTSGRIAFHHGGVARNVAHNLCLLGHEVRLMTVFGDDDFAAKLMADCKNIGMDLSLSTQFKGASSPVFLSFNDAEGNMQSAVSDIELNSKMDLDWLKAKMDEINASEVVVTDTLLSVEALAYLLDHCRVSLYIDTVSPGRAMRLVKAMEISERHSVFALKCNFDEAVALTGKNEAIEAVKELNNRGIKHIYLTLGSSGVVYAGKGEILSYQALLGPVVNVMGSGDAFLAGVVHAHALGHDGKDAVDFGLKAAQHNIKNEAPVNPTLRDSVFDV